MWAANVSQEMWAASVSREMWAASVSQEMWEASVSREMWAASVSQENYMSVGLLTWEQMENYLANPFIKMFNNKFFLTECFT